MIVTKIFRFEASHKLEGYNGKCANLHGHSYKLHVSVSGDVKDGFVMDFHELKKIVQEEVISQLDHTYLNDIIEFPTAENMLKWIWDKLEGKVNISKLLMYETEDSYVEYVKE